MRQSFKYFFLASAVFLAYLFFHGLGLDQNIRLIQMLMAGLIVYFCTMIYLSWKSEKNTEHMDFTKIISYILILGFTMRIGYMLYTACNVRAHDLWELSPDAYGHAAYLLQLMIYKRLPVTNEIQFYQQPFFYILSSFVSKIINGILGRSDYYDLVDAAKVVSCFASCGILLMCREFCEFLEIKPQNQCLILLILAFFPDFFLTGGRVTPDSLATFFMMAAVLYTFRWQKSQSFKNTIMLALCFGFGMMTKISCSTVALFTFIIMCHVLIQKLHDHTWTTLIPKLAVFGIISLPLGLWYSVRNYLLFRQPLNYVLPIPKSLRIYCGDVPYFQRFITWDLHSLLSTPFCNAWTDYNLPVYIFKSSLFGEFTYKIWNFIPVILLWSNILLIICSIFAVFLLPKTKFSLNTSHYSLLLLWGILLIFNLYFNISYPFGCSMDFRYILLTAVLGSLFLGMTYNASLPSSWKENTFLNRCYVIYQSALPVLTFIFCLFSFLMYTLIQE